MLGHVRMNMISPLRRKQTDCVTTLPEPIGSEHAVHTLRIQAVQHAIFGLPKQFAVRATANQNPQEATRTRGPATVRRLRRGEPQRNNLDAE